MSSFKGDQRFTRRWDAANDHHDDDTQQSENSSDNEWTIHEDDAKHGDWKPFYTQYRKWVREHEEELLDMYRAFTSAGDALFGKAFHQMGSFESFCDYCFRTTFPGASKI